MSVSKPDTTTSLDDYMGAMDVLRIGPSVRPVSVHSLSLELQSSDDVTLAFLDSIGVPVVRFPRGEFFNSWALEFALFVLMAPGGPYYEPISKRRTNSVAMRRVRGLLPWMADRPPESWVMMQSLVAFTQQNLEVGEAKRRLGKLADLLLDQALSDSKWKKTKSRKGSPVSRKTRGPAQIATTNWEEIK